MEIQTTFLDKIPTDEPEEKAQPVNEDLKNWALVYLVTYAGGNSGNLFVLKKEDAMKFCEDDCSHGFGRGGEWMMQWTSLDHFAEQGAESARKQNENVHGRLEPFVFIRDTGKQDEDFERLGIAKPTLEESRRLVNEMGYELTYKGALLI